MNSDYRSSDGSISRVAVIEFFLAQVAENCSFSRSWGFEEGEGRGCALWRVGEGVRLVNTQQSPRPIQNTFTGTALYAASADSQVVLASSLIDDDFCGVSFAYAVSSSTELILLADGLNSVWSSLASPGVTGWANLTVQLDFQDVEILRNRSLSFVARFSGNEEDSAYVASAYAALDNITLHPCTDCATPGQLTCQANSIFDAVRLYMLIVLQFALSLHVFLGITTPWTTGAVWTAPQDTSEDTNPSHRM